jgi:hypothetical protein
MTALYSIRIAAKIYDDIGDYSSADILDQFIKEAGSKSYSPKDFMKALPLLFGAGTLGVVSPTPTAPPAQIQQQMDQQSVYDSYGEDSEFDTENYKAPVKQQKPKIQKPVPEVKPQVSKQQSTPIQQAPIKQNPSPKRPISTLQQGPKGNFNETMDIMFKVEGGKTDEDADRGGRTNLGITQRTYNEWLKKNKMKPADVFNISKSTAYKIYKEGYWNVIKGDKLPHNVAKAIMSMALTDGPQDSIRFVQKLLGVEVTGFMGPKTLAAIWAKCKKDDKQLTKNILDAQKDKYQRGQEEYRKGWGNRVDYVAENID